MWTVDTLYNTLICLSVCLTSVLLKTFFSRSTIYLSDNQLLIMTFQIHRHFHFYTGMSSPTFSEEEPFCCYMKKLLCIWACKIFGVKRMIWIFTLPDPSLILTCSLLQRETQTNLGIFGTSDCFSLEFLWMFWLFYYQPSHPKYLQNNNNEEAIIKFQLFFFVCCSDSARNVERKRCPPLKKFRL